VPFTLNGIGTRYYGASNRSAHVDVCQKCGRSATISSYDTREWFCIIYIPLIPIAKYRILDDCSRCRRHHRLSLKQFSEELQKTLSPLRDAIKRSPRDPQPYIELIRTLIGWKMRADAQRELEAATRLFPQDVELTILDAQLSVDGGDWNRALSMYERAYKTEPQNPTAAYGYGWLLNQMERHEQAISILQSAAAQQRSKSGALYLLGSAQMKLSRWNDALNSYEQLFTLEPKYTADKNLLRQIRECKQHLGYQLTEAERRAGRRWWPFGRSTKLKPMKPQGATALVRPSLAIAGLILVAISLFSFGFYEWDRRANMEVYFDNGLDRAVRLDLDGKHLNLGRNNRTKEELKDGPHAVIVRDVAGKEIERLTFHLDEMSIFQSPFHDRFFVYNVGGQRVYRRGTHGFARNRENASYSEELIGMQRFFEMRDIDYPFQQPPDSISVDANSSSAVLKTSFNAAEDIDLPTFAMIRLRQGKTDEAKTAIEHAVASAPCDTRTRRTQVYFASTAGSLDAASDTAHRWITDCAQNNLEAHRAYQDINNENERQEALRDEYGRLLASSPNSAEAHYLYGRVENDPADAAAQYQEAIRLDPKLIWPRVALGHAYQMMERYDDAMREFAAALDMEGRDDSTAIYYAMAAIGKGSPFSALAKVDDVRKSHPRELGAIRARWLLAVAMSDWDKAAALQKNLASLDSPEAMWWNTTKLLRFKEDPTVDATIDAGLRDRNLQQLALNARIERLLEKGEFAAAAEMIAKSGKALQPSSAALLEAYAGGGLLLQGDAQSAEKLLADAEKLVASAPKSRERKVAAAVIAGLRGSQSVDSVMAAAREADATAHAWFVAGVRAAVAHDSLGKRALLAHCIRASSDLEFPYLEVRALLLRSGT